MTKDLERDLGLFEVMAISIGAMVGSGIFILPALAIGKSGPSLILGYLLAGVLVLPAALSKAEMATAMPESGGTYVYIERGMGPLLGTIAGLGTWFALSFKGALALVGGVPYLALLVDVPVVPVALGLATILLVVNLLGAKQTGRLQTVIVVVMLAALSWFVLGGVGSIEGARYDPFFAGGASGLFAVTGLVFVSYAGVTKIASVAEEVEDPGRNIPLGMLGSLGFTTLLYVLIVSVIVGVAPDDEIAATEAPMAIAAEYILGTPGVAAVILAALLALVSTANAGILSSSRYPFAMSRDGLVPPSLSTVSERFKTPATAIGLTGVVLLALIAFVPVLQIAKLASAFQILVFVLVNVAVVAFREGDVDWYEPEFTSPLYPWVQAFGALSGAALLTQMGTIPIVGSLLIIAGSLLWYGTYVRGRVDREGVATRALRRGVRDRVVERTGEEMGAGPGETVLVAVTEGTDERREQRLVRAAATVARRRDSNLTVVQFDEVPDQTPLSHAAAVESPADVRFEEQTDRITSDLDVPVTYGEIVSHDTRRALVNFVANHDVDFLVAEREPPGLPSHDVEWAVRHAPCDAMLVTDRNPETVDTVAVVTDDGPYDPLKLNVADALATEAGATLHLLYPVRRPANERRGSTIESYLDGLREMCTAPVETTLVDADEDLATQAAFADVVVAATDERRSTLDRLLDRSTVVDQLDGTLVLIHRSDAKLEGGLVRAVRRRAL